MTTTTAAFAAPSPGDDNVQIRDFTIKQKKIQFRIDEDVFHAYAILGLPLLQELVQVSKSIGKMIDDQRYEGIFDVFDKMLYPASAERFRERAGAIGDDALDVRKQLMPILHFLLEEYGVRPTQPSSDSSGSLPSGTSGTSSTAGSSLVDSGSTG